MNLDFPLQSTLLILIVGLIGWFIWMRWQQQRQAEQRIQLAHALAVESGYPLRFVSTSVHSRESQVEEDEEDDGSSH